MDEKAPSISCSRYIQILIKNQSFCLFNHLEFVIQVSKFYENHDFPSLGSHGS